MDNNKKLQGSGYSNHGRWYDAYETIRDLIDVMEFLPQSVQENIGKQLQEDLQKYYDFGTDPYAVKSLGPEVVLGLHKSRNRRRWYDKVPYLYTAINKLSVLPEEALQDLEDVYAGLVEEIQLYEAYSPFKKEHFINAYLKSPHHVEIRRNSGHYRQPPHIRSNLK